MPILPPYMSKCRSSSLSLVSRPSSYTVEMQLDWGSSNIRLPSSSNLWFYIIYEYETMNGLVSVWIYISLLGDEDGGYILVIFHVAVILTPACQSPTLIPLPYLISNDSIPPTSYLSA